MTSAPCVTSRSVALTSAPCVTSRSVTLTSAPALCHQPIGPEQDKYEWAESPDQGDCSIRIIGADLKYDDGLWLCQVTSSSFQTQDALKSAPAQLVVRGRSADCGVSMGQFRSEQVRTGQYMLLFAGTGQCKLVWVNTGQCISVVFSAVICPVPSAQVGAGQVSFRSARLAWAYAVM